MESSRISEKNLTLIWLSIILMDWWMHIRSIRFLQLVIDFTQFGKRLLFVLKLFHSFYHLLHVIRLILGVECFVLVKTVCSDEWIILLFICGYQYTDENRDNYCLKMHKRSQKNCILSFILMVFLLFLPKQKKIFHHHPFWFL